MSRLELLLELFDRDRFPMVSLENNSTKTQMALVSWRSLEEGGRRKASRKGHAATNAQRQARGGAAFGQASRWTHRQSGGKHRPWHHSRALELLRHEGRPPSSPSNNPCLSAGLLPCYRVLPTAALAAAWCRQRQLPTQFQMTVAPVFWILFRGNDSSTDSSSCRTCSFISVSTYRFRLKCMIFVDCAFLALVGHVLSWVAGQIRVSASSVACPEWQSGYTWIVLIFAGMLLLSFTNLLLLCHHYSGLRRPVTAALIHAIRARARRARISAAASFAGITTAVACYYSYFECTGFALDTCKAHQATYQAFRCLCAVDGFCPEQGYTDYGYSYPWDAMLTGVVVGRLAFGMLGFLWICGFIDWAATKMGSVGSANSEPLLPAAEEGACD